MSQLNLFQCFHKINVHSSDVNCVAFSSQLLATCSGDKTVRLWNFPEFNESKHSPLKGHSYYVYCCEFSPFGTLLASCSMDGQLIIWNIKDGSKKSVFTHPSLTSIRVCKFSPGSDMVASGSDDFSLCLWDISSSTLIRTFSGHEGSVVTCSFSQDSHFIVSGSSAGDIRIWDAKFGQGKCLKIIPDAHDLGVMCCTFSHSCDTRISDMLTLSNESSVYSLVSGGQDSLVKVWRLEAELGSGNVTVKLQEILTGHESSVQFVAVSGDDQLIASASIDKNIRLWNMVTGQHLQTLIGHSRYVTCCAFSCDDQYLASGSNDRTVIIWKRSSEGLLQNDDVSNVDKNTPSGSKSFTLSRGWAQWSVEQVGRWIAEDLQLPQYEQTFVDNAIDGPELKHLTDVVLKDVLGIAALGHRNKILRSIATLKDNKSSQWLTSSSFSVPDEFLCPITREIMNDPVMASDGFTYERHAISAWIKKGCTLSPMTNKELDNLDLIPNRTLKMLLSQHPA